MADQLKDSEKFNKEIQKSIKNLSDLTKQYTEASNTVSKLKNENEEYLKLQLRFKKGDERWEQVQVKIRENEEKLNKEKKTEKDLLISKNKLDREIERKKKEEIQQKTQSINEEKKKLLSTQKSSSELFKLNNEQLSQIRIFSKSMGLTIDGFSIKNKESTDIFDLMVSIKKNELNEEKKKLTQIRENWYVQDGFVKRFKGLSKSLAYDAKDYFFKQTGILGKSVSAVGKLFFGKNLGGEQRIGGEEKTLQLENISEDIKFRQTLHDDFQKLAELLSERKKKGGQPKEKEEKATEQKIIQKDNKESGGMRNENKDKGFIQSVKQTKLLQKILEKKQDMKGFGLGGLLAIGGLLGYLLFGESRHIKELMKGFVKFEQLGKFFGVGEKLEHLGKSMKALAEMKYIQLLEKLPTGALKIMSRLQGPIKGLGKLMKGIGSIGKLIPMVGTVGKLGKFAKLGLGFLKKIPGLGAIIGIILGVQKWKKGDKLGAIMEFGSGIASLFPGIGTAVSIAIDLASFFRDNKLEKDAMASEKDTGGWTGSVGVTKPKGFAKGGVAWNKQLAWVAENGPEKITPLNNKENITSNIQSYASNVTKNPNEIQTIKLHKDSIVELAKQMQKGFGTELNKTGQFTAKDSPSGSL